MGATHHAAKKGLLEALPFIAGVVCGDWWESLSHHS